MKRKFGGLLLALCMALCLLPSAAFAADGAACPRCGRTVSAIEGDFAVKLSDMNTNHYQTYRCSGCANTFLANQALPHRGGVAAHTAGSVAADVLRAAGWERYGVVYPFQTFTAGRRVDFSQVPLFVEGSDEAAACLLEGFARRLGRTVFRASSEQRRAVHLTGVLACNFVNALYSMAADYLASRAALHVDVLHPIIMETARKAVALAHPRDGQTGPAVRNDRAVISRHEDMLAGEPLQRDIYRLLTEYIWETSRKI